MGTRLSALWMNDKEAATCSQCVPVSLNTLPPAKKGVLPVSKCFSLLGWQERTPNLTSCPAPCNILWQRLGTHRSLSVSVRVFCCRRWTMKTVTATPMMRPMATTPPRIPITPPGGPCGIGFSADKREENNSVRTGALWVIDAAVVKLKNSSGERETVMLRACVCVCVCVCNWQENLL